jgi:hypothetical protein
MEIASIERASVQHDDSLYLLLILELTYSGRERGDRLLRGRLTVSARRHRSDGEQTQCQDTDRIDESHDWVLL